MSLRTIAVATLLVAVPWRAAWSQQQDVTLCGQPVAPPSQLPPADHGPVVYLLGLCFPTQGDISAVEPETYLYYVQLRPSRPSQGAWVPYDAAAEETIREDFTRLWATNFLDDLRIEATDYVFPNGVVGKVITYFLEERARIKVVTYQGTNVLDHTKIDETLREHGIEIRLDSFFDQGVVTRATRVLREAMAEKGFTDAKITHTVSAVAGGPKVVNLTFNIDEGPRIAIRDVEFLGNTALNDETLLRALKENRPQTLLSFITGSGHYREQKAEEDAEAVQEYYRDRGYIAARVGQPEVRTLDDSADGRTRWVQLRIPVAEGVRHRVGAIMLEGNQIVASEALRGLFALKEGDRYSERAIRSGLEKARESYGAGGYMEFTGFPDLRPREPVAPDGGPPLVDVVIRVTEGPRYVVNRITFAGNTTTRDQVIRREMRLVEAGVFNTEALKDSVRRLNQLGYFKPIEGSQKDLQVEKSPSREHAVDVTLKLQEHNRNQIQFGAGVSQYEGVFGNASYTTTNFMGRGESLTVTGQKGSRSSAYQVAFTEPYLFNRPITGGIDLYSRKIDYLTGTDVVGYSEVRSGVNLTTGYALFGYSRVFLTYGYEVIDTAVSDSLAAELDLDASVGVPAFNAFLDEGRHVESRVTPSFVHNTVDNPFMPRSGRKLTFSLPVAGGFLGGTTNYVRPEIEVIQYLPHTRRTALGLRFNAGWLRPYGSSEALPYYLRYFLGGEYQIRGVDIRTVGPTDSQNRAIGGSRFVLFNAEYYFDLFGPIRALLFHDAGQAFSETQPIDLRQLRTSSGVELRVIVPMLNVPFRLIYAWNTYRDTFQPARSFKFAVGTTF